MAQHHEILVVEPNDLHLAFLSHVVEHKGLTSHVRFCRSGHSTMSYIGLSPEGAQIYGCILELSLPDMHGAELVDQLRARDDLQPIKFVVFSSSIDALAEDHARILSGCRMVRKPPSPLELQEQFCAILKSMNVEAKMVAELICSEPPS